MAQNWSTTQSTPARTANAAYGTSLAHLDWTFDLSAFTVPGSSGTVTKDWEFLSDLEGWQHYGINITRWVGTDGDPAPGCLEGYGIQSHNGINFDSWPGVAFLWTDIGVPANAYVDSVALSCNLVHATAMAFPEGDGVQGTVESGSLQSAAFTTPDLTTVTSWTGYSGTVTFPNGANTIGTQTAAISMRAVPNNHMVANMHLDHVIIDVHYVVLPVYEYFQTGPVVSKGGYVWAVTQATDFVTPGRQFYLLCLTNTGTVVSHTRLLDNGGFDPTAPNIPCSITTDDNDHAYIVYDDCVKAYAPDGTLLWTHGDFRSFYPGYLSSCVDPATGLVWVGNNFGPTVVMEALSPVDGSVDHSFDTGNGSAFATSFSLSSGYLYLSLYPMIVAKWSTSGVNAWAADVSIMGPGFGNRLYGTSTNGSHVYTLASTSNDLNENAIVSIKDVDGTYEWNYQSVDLSTPDKGEDGVCVDPSTGYVIVDLINDAVSNNLAVALDSATGGVIWTYNDSTEVTGSPITPSSAIGNDGFLIRSVKDAVRLKISDGSKDSTGAAGTFPNAVALSSDHTYIADGNTPGVLWAYGGVLPTIAASSDSTVSARATLINAGVPVGGGNAIHARSAGVVAHAVLTAAQNACLEVYFAGMDNGDDFTVMAYSAPTELCLLNPVAGHEYILEAPAADLARFLGKRMGNVKFRRAGAGGNYTGDILLRAIELYYKTRTT